MSLNKQAIYWNGRWAWKAARAVRVYTYFLTRLDNTLDYFWKVYVRISIWLLIQLNFKKGGSLQQSFCLVKLLLFLSVSQCPNPRPFIWCKCKQPWQDLLLSTDFILSLNTMFVLPHTSLYIYLREDLVWSQISSVMRPFHKKATFLTSAWRKLRFLRPQQPCACTGENPSLELSRSSICCNCLKLRLSSQVHRTTSIKIFTPKIAL